MLKKLRSIFSPTPKYNSVVEAYLAEDYDFVFAWHKAQDFKENPAALLNLAHMYRDGQGTKVNTTEYKKLLREAAELGVIDAIFEILQNVEQEDPEDAKEQFVYWLKKASEQDNVFALRSIGEYYSNGKSIAPDAAKAIDYYSRAAAQNDLDSLVFLGALYFKGEIVEQDYKKSAEWFSKAAELGDATGEAVMAMCYEQGKGVVKNPYKAQELYTLAANKGNVSAMKSLGIMYIVSDVIPNDNIQAYKWLNLAGVEDKEAADLRDKIEQQMNKDQLTLSIRLCDEWQRENEIRNRGAKLNDL